MTKSEPHTKQLPLLVALILLGLTVGAAAPATSNHADTIDVTVSLEGTTGDNGWWITPVTVTLGCPSGNPSCAPEYRLGGGPWTPYSDPFVHALEGSTLLEARGHNDLGEATELVERLLHVDVNPPVTEPHISGTLGDNGWLTTPVDLSFSCTDTASGCATIHHSIDGAPSTQGAGPISIDTDGTHEVRFRAVDHAGLREGIQTTTIRVDQSGPEWVHQDDCSLMGDNGWCRGPQTTSLTPTDPHSGIQSRSCTIDAAPAPCTAVEATSDGIHQINGEATNQAGIRSLVDTTARIDATTPTASLSLSGPTTSDGWYTGPVTINVGCQDDTSGCDLVRLLVDGTNVALTDDSHTISADGTYSIEGRTRDRAGNWGTTGTTQLRIDQSAPTAGHQLDGVRGAADWFTSTVSTTLTCQDDGIGCDHIDYALDQEPSRTYTGAFPITGDARHELTYTATDLAGHTSAPTTTTVPIDETPPQVTLSISCDDWGNDAWCRGTAQAHPETNDDTSGINTETCSLMGVEAPCAQLATNKDGEHAAVVSVTDHAGHVTTAETVLNVDGTPATHELVKECPRTGQDGWCAAPVTSHAVATDAVSGLDHVRCFINGDPAACDGAIHDTSGTHNVVIESRDIAHNTAITSHPVKVDLLPPEAVQTRSCTTSWREDWCRGSVEVISQGWDNQSGITAMTCSLDDQGIPCGARTINEEGWHRYTVRIRDRAGHVTQETILFGIDRTPPGLTVLRPESGCTYLDDAAASCGAPVTSAVGGLTIMVSATDAHSGIDRHEFRVDGRFGAVRGGDAASWYWPNDRPLPVTNQIRVTTFDIAGNQAVATFDIQGVPLASDLPA